MKIVINKCYGGFGLSKRAKAWLSERGCVDVGDLARTDSLLIECVEAFEAEGKDASGAHASLSVVEIPDDVEYTIEEYDGVEWIAEEHQTWS